MKDFKSVLAFFLTTISLLAIVVIFHYNYSEISNLNPLVVLGSFPVIALLIIIIVKYKKPLFLISESGSLIYSFCIVEEIFSLLEISDKVIIFFIELMLTVFLSILTEFIIEEISPTNVIIDAILGIITIFLVKNVNLIVQEDSSLITIIQLASICIYSFIVVMVNIPVQLRKMKKD